MFENLALLLIWGCKKRYTSISRPKNPTERIPWVNPGLGAKFYDSRFEIAITMDKMSIFNSPRNKK